MSRMYNLKQDQSQDVTLVLFGYFKAEAESKYNAIILYNIYWLNVNNWYLAIF